ncbi:MAG: acyl carrier protein [Candidatus Heimdallarchaeota archaeon]|nr:MAG: acyl carrier protein [Candidatus Heimdallarchaeota archaeon]
MADVQVIFEDVISKILLLENEQINDNVSRDNLEEWDSMTHLALISELEQVFDIILSDDDVTEIKTIGDIKKTLNKYEIKVK